MQITIVNTKVLHLYNNIPKVNNTVVTAKNKLLTTLHFSSNKIL